MNAFGIDYGRTLSVVCLRDGKGARARTRLVGDGFRASIPHAVSAPPESTSPEESLLWGSRALDSRIAEPALRPEPSSGGPWLDQPGAVLFWRGLMRRLTAYVGRVKPLPSNGYDVVVAVQTDNLSRSAEEVKHLSREAGFEGVAVIPAPHALLCRWMTEAVLTPWGEGAQTLAAVCVGDDSVSVCAYRLTMRGSQVPEVTTASRCFSISGCGGAMWTTRLLQEVAARWREDPDRVDETALRDAATEFGARIGRSRNNEQVEWDGPLAERMFERLCLSRRECQEWPEVAPLRQQLPQILREAAQAVSGREKVDLVLVGGVGAMWPFAAEVAASYGTIWQSGFPLEDVARGAACWPEAGEPNSSMLPLDGSPAGFGGALSGSSSAFPALDMGAPVPVDLSFEAFANGYNDADDSALTPVPENGGAEADDELEEADDDIPPSQRWRME